MHREPNSRQRPAAAAPRQGQPPARRTGPAPEQRGDLGQRLQTRPPLTKAQKKAREKAVRQRIKEKKKRAKQEARALKRRQKARKRAQAASRRMEQSSTPPTRLTHSEARRRRRQRTLIAAGVLLILIVSGFFLSVTVLFKIQAFRVEGECRYSQQQLEQAFGHEAGENMFRFSLAGAEEQMLRQLPYLEAIRVRRRLPDTVVFFVTPAVEAYYLEQGEGVLLLSEGLKVLATGAQPAGELCRLVGLEPKDPVPGQAFSTGVEETDALVRTLLSALRTSGVGQVTEVDLSDPYELAFTCGGRIRVKLGSTAQLEYKLKVVARTLQDGYFTPDTVGTLDASDAGKAVFKPA